MQTSDEQIRSEGRILVVDDEVQLMQALCEMLETQQYEVHGCSSGEEALTALKQKNYDVLITDFMMPGMDGLALLKAALEIDSNIMVIIMTGQGAVPNAVNAMKSGAFDYILKPFKIKTILPLLSRAMDNHRLRVENAQLREAMAIYELNQMIAYRLETDVVLHMAAEIALRHYQADEFSIQFLNNNELCVAIARGDHTDLKTGDCEQLDEGVAGWVAMHREPLALRDKQDKRFSSLYKRTDILESLCVPMMAGDELVGVLNLNRTQQHQPFTAGQIKALTVFANTVAAALQASRLYEKLSKSEERYRQVLDNVNEIVYKIDVSSNDPLHIGLVSLVSSHVEDILGYKPQEFIDDPDLWASLLHPDDVQQIKRETVKLYKQNRAISREYRLRHKHTGEYHWVDDRVLPSLDEDGNLVSLFGVARDITERKSAEERLNYLAYHDSLTGLPNRVLLMERLSDALLEADRHQRLVAVLFLDLDRFKNINDSLGHKAGDNLLQQVAKLLKQAVRAGDTVARHGGDEFTIVLADVAHIDDVAHVAQKIMDQFNDALTIENKQFFITPSIGITIYPLDDKSPEVLLKNADTALYHAKDSGRSTFQFFTEELNKRVEMQLGLEMALRQAIEHNEFLLHYQPQVDLVSGNIIGVEALVRWQRDDKMVSPLDFIPLAEDTGLIVPIGEWVLRTACQQAESWQVNGLSKIKMSINLSARQFREKNLVNMVQRVLVETGFNAGNLVLEITESAIMDDAETAQKTMNELAALGIGLAIDDFGTGYSSLGYLKRFPISWLKIDRSFVKDITTEPDDAVIAHAIINLSHSLGVKVVAEGVETTPQLAFLQLRGCDAIQGYLFSKPLPSCEMTRLLAEKQKLNLPDLEDEVAERALLIVDDEKNICQALKRVLRNEGYSIYNASNPTEAFEVLAEHNVGVILSDQRMPGMKGVDFLSKVKQIYPDTIRIVMSGYADLESLTGAINRGSVYRFLMKPWDDDQLKHDLRDAFRQYALRLYDKGQAAGE